jgi:integrase
LRQADHASPVYDVRIWKTRTYRGRTRTTHSVRWRVHGQEHHKTFLTAKLAESFRSELVVAARQGSAFNTRTGLPASMPAADAPITWYDHACAFIDMKWPHASPRHRKSLAEGLVTATCALTPRRPESPPLEDQRTVLLGWAFNLTARQGVQVAQAPPPDPIAGTVEWLARNSLPLVEFARPVKLRRMLEALALNLDGTAASPSTVARKRSAVYSALSYAVEQELLPVNPMDRLKVTRPEQIRAVDRRVVVNPQQAQALIDAVRAIHAPLEAFFACLYYSGLRPAEARHLRSSDLVLPSTGWGSLLLLGSTPTAGAAWTDSGTADEDRQLKHRARRDTRPVPAPPQLVSILRRHLELFPSGLDGRLFVARTGRAGVPLAAPYAKPQPMGVVYYVWDRARKRALTPTEYSSPLARRPYDLRHAAVSLWLNAGVPATQVAEWAGHSVNVLLRVYAKCIVGQEEAAKRRIETALQGNL